MNIALITRSADTRETYLRELIALGATLSDAPDFVFCVGGDGTLLIAERQFPGVPKVQIRESEYCRTCPEPRPLSEICDSLRSESYSLRDFAKLRVRWIRKDAVLGDFLAANDVVIRNKLVVQALRFSIDVSGSRVFGNEIIGDGVIISSPFGSTGYYQSITKNSFSRGIGIALSHPITPEINKVVRDSSTIKVTITRMEADFGIDNDLNIHTLVPGDVVEISTADSVMRIVSLE